MKLRTKILASAVIALMASAAHADPVYIDVGADIDGIIGGDADSQTAVFNLFTLAEFSPESTYFDTNSDTYVSTGDVVVDIGQTTVLGLNPISGTAASTELFGPSWGLDVTWSLIGLAGVSGGNGVIGDGIGDAGETLGAQFFGGTVDFIFSNVGGVSPIADGTTVISVAVNNSAIDTTTGISLDIFGEVVSALDNFIYFAAGDEDFFDLLSAIPPIKITAFADAELDAETLPVTDTADATAVALFESVTGLTASDYDQFTRSTVLRSPNAEFSRVPAPTVLALLGLGLVGLRVASRKMVVR